MTTDTPLDVVTGLAVVATLFLGAATVWLGLTTRRGLAQQADQFVETERNAVLPFPVIDGRYFFRERLLLPTGQLRPNTVVAPTTGALVLEATALRNLGRGPALYVQWGLTAATPTNPVFEHDRIRPTHLPQGQTLYLWHPLPDIDTQAVGHNWRVTLWYDDTSGNHYRCVYRRQGDLWLEESRQPVPYRPPFTPVNGLDL